MWWNVTFYVDEYHCVVYPGYSDAGSGPRSCKYIAKTLPRYSSTFFKDVQEFKIIKKRKILKLFISWLLNKKGQVPGVLIFPTTFGRCCCC